MYFSIITPIHNVAGFIKRGAESILSQSFGDFQWILVNDGSTDNSGHLCEELKKKDSRIVIVHQSKSGPGPARNKGIETACGEYLLFFDIDDQLRPDALYKMASILRESNPEVAVFSYSEICQANTTSNDFVFPELLLSDNNEIRSHYIECLSGIKFNNGFVWNKAYRRDFIEHYNLRFKALRIQQDEVFNLELYPYVQRMTISPEIIYDYYVYQKGNASSSIIATRPEVAIAVRNAFLSLVDTWNLSDEKLFFYIHKRFVSQYLFMSLNREVLNKKINANRNERLQYIKNLLDNSSLGQSLNYLITVGYQPETFFKRLYFKLANSKSASNIELVCRVSSVIEKIKIFLRKVYRFFHKLWK